MGNPGETWVGGVSIVLYALTVCVSLRLTGNLWFAIGMHAAGDWVETYIFGCPTAVISLAAALQTPYSREASG